MPYDFHDAVLLHEGGKGAGTPLNLVGILWANEAIPHEPGEGFVIIDLAHPVYFEIDQSRTPLCRVMLHGRVVETHRFGFWQLAQIEGLANELDGSITSRGFTTTGFDIEDVLKNWLDVPSPKQTPTRPTRCHQIPL